VNVTIRPAASGDRAQIRSVHLAAFPTAAEADLVERLEAEGDTVVSLVATTERDAVAGHVLLSRMRAQADRRTFRAVGLGPVAVQPALHNQGIGGTLIREALTIAKEAGEEFVFVLGEPDYYRRFGFSHGTAAPFDSPYAGPYFMAIACAGLELPGKGRADYAPAFAALG
jgi:putative acetyltransferase